MSVRGPHRCRGDFFCIVVCGGSGAQSYHSITDEVYRAYMWCNRKIRYFESYLKPEYFILGREGQVVQIIPSCEDSLGRL